MTDTIAAIATGDSLCAIGIIRISGSQSIQAVGRIFKSIDGHSAENFVSRKLYYGELMDVRGLVLDNCLCTVSRGPNSYTGEDTAELQCHGSPVVLSEALKSLFAQGVRQAEAGEFTRRAFLNGRMDLVQAEAVIDLISAETAETAVNAAGQLGGAVSRRTDAIYDSLTDIMAHFHAVLDYSDEDIQPFKIDEYVSEFKSYISQLKELTQSFSRGAVMKNGVKCAIVGKPNAGKSSLLNALVGYDRAIVTDVPGTTRDTVEERVRLGDILLRISDTAGLRETDDPVEQLGAQRARAAAADARLVLAVFDGSRPLDQEDIEAVTAAACAEHSIAVINKSDVPQVIDMSEIEGHFQRICRVSAIDKTGIDSLEQEAADVFGGSKATPAGEILTNSRHYDVVMRAGKSLESAVAALNAGMTPDAVLTDIEEAMEAMGELTGKTIREDITSRIFQRFCVGK